MANGRGATHTLHNFATTVALGGTALAPGVRTICVQGVNFGPYGATRNVACQTVNLNYNPVATDLMLRQESPGARIVGWALDPDTSDPVNVTLIADGTTVATVPANRAGSPHTGHIFNARVNLPNGKHTICAVAVNLSFGTGNSAPSCKTVTLNFNPFRNA